MDETEARDALLDRRGQIDAAIARGGATPDLTQLRFQVDEALSEVAAGTYGHCDDCGDPIESDILRADPLARFCVDHLTDAERRALQLDLDLAAEVQRALLPAPEISFDGWRLQHYFEPAGAVSGDYCDVLRTPSSALLFLVGDAMGKGVAASILMAQLHAIVRSLAALDLTARELMERANRVFCENRLSGHYATLVCGRADAQGHLEICNAGHWQPLLFQSGRVVRMEADAPPLGLFRGARYTSHELTLQPPDTLLLYTDGLTEARNSSDEEFGVERLAARFAEAGGQPPDGVLRACLTAAAAFAPAQARRTDDLTLMVVQRA
jgi:phosphoserine phosphatase RsbU/P